MKRTFCFALFVALTIAFSVGASAHWPEPGTNEVVTVAGTGSHGAWDGGLSQFNLPMAVISDGQGGFIVADTFNNLIRHISGDGTVTTASGAITDIAADSFPAGSYIDGPMGEAGFWRPVSLALPFGGGLFIADSQNNAIRVITNGDVFTVAGGIGAGYASGGPDEVMFDMPGAIAMHPDGYLYVADTSNHVIRRISPEGYTVTVAGQGGVPGYYNGPAEYALFYGPMGLAISPDGRIFVADTGNHLIRVIEDGTVRTLAGTRNLVEAYPSGGMEDALYTLDGFENGWETYPIGGFTDGWPGMAMFYQPMGLALWGEYLIVADSANHSIRVVSPQGEVRTLTGTGEPGFVFGATGIAAFHFPMGVYVYGDLLIIADTGNNMIRALNLIFTEVQYE